MARFLAASVLLWSALGLAQAQSFMPSENALNFSPKILRVKGVGATLGLGYSFSRGLYQRDFSLADADRGLDADAAVRSFVVNLTGKGTFAAIAERNPKNFLETQVEAVAVQSTRAGGTWIGGLALGYEADQRWEKRQPVASLMGTYAKRNAFMRNDLAGLHLAYARVNPVEDSERRALLGAAHDKAFKRAYAEGVYQIQTGHDLVQTVELNVRLFRELGAPAVIRQAGLDRHRLATIRFGLKKGFFVAFSHGRLPFERDDERAVEVGWSIDLFK
jgi:hypothetical protein